MSKTPERGMLKSKRSCESSTSEMTIYQRAVPRMELDVNNQIQQFIEDDRGDLDMNRRNVSTSSDETAMDTSDENDLNLTGSNQNNVLFHMTGEDKAGPSSAVQVKRTVEEQAEQVIKDSEQSKACLYEVPAKVMPTPSNPLEMDLDYQMIDSHTDAQMCKHIQCFEYIDFSKLISWSRSGSEDQRLEIINHNGSTFLSPVSDQEILHINSYSRWEQAFGVYSNILTAKFLQKATELFQYNHTIQTASSSYIWDNVYSYDREFR